MEVPVYYFACEKDGQTYVACLDSSHAEIRPVEEVLDGSRTLLLYTNRGAAGKAIKNRNIRGFFKRDTAYEYGHWITPAIVEKKNLRVRTAKLTLDK